MDLFYILPPGIKWRVTSKLLPPYLHKSRFTAAVPLRIQLFPWNRRNITTESLYHYNFIQLTCGCRACRLSFDGTMPCRHVAQLSWEVATGTDDSCKATATEPRRVYRLWQVMTGSFNCWFQFFELTIINLCSGCLEKICEQRQKSGFELTLLVCLELFQ